MGYFALIFFYVVIWKSLGLYFTISKLQSLKSTGAQEYLKEVIIILWSDGFMAIIITWLSRIG